MPRANHHNHLEGAGPYILVLEGETSLLRAENMAFLDDSV